MAFLYLLFRVAVLSERFLAISPKSDLGRRSLRLRIPLGLGCGLGLLFFLASASFALGCDQLPEGQLLFIRLSSPVSTYTAHVGDAVHAVLTQDVGCGDDVLLPMGTTIDGVVRSKRKVGWGIRHETAALELEFNRAIVAMVQPSRCRPKWRTWKTRASR